MYSYKDFMTGKIKRTRGKFTGWSEPMGPLNARYAIFQNCMSQVLVPRYLVTPETLERIGPPDDAQQVVTDAKPDIGVDHE